MAATAETDFAGPTRGAERFEGVDRWSAHPYIARATRAVAYGVPLVVAVTSGWLVGRQELTHAWSPLMRWTVMSIVATVVLVSVERVARRLLPLSALLNLSLVFPDRAPSRFAIALRAGSVGQLEQRLQPGADGAIGTDRADAAARILARVLALHAHDRRTRGHSERVRAFAVLIGKEMGLRPEQLDKLQWAALLHDVGKLDVPTSILNKDGRPSEEEWAALVLHPAHGERQIAPLALWLGDWAGGVTQHHERWDGGGYPRGLCGEDIALSGRIVAVADAFEVMTAARSYKKPLSIAAARIELTRCAGEQFDPTVVRALLNVSVPRVHRVLSPLAWLGQSPMVPSLAAIPAPGAIAATGAVVAGLVLGPTVVPMFEGAAAADAAMATTANPATTTAQSPSPQRGQDHAGPVGATTEPPAVMSPESTVAPTPEPTRVTNDAEPPTLPALPAPRDIAPLASPVVDDVVTPLVDDVLAPLVDDVVTPLVGDVVTPLTDAVLTPPGG